MKSGIVQKAIDPAKILNSVMDKSAGGIVLFVGTIRNRTNGAEVTGLEYEIYREMAQRRIAELEKQIKERWPIKSIRLVHREGKLSVGDVSVVVAVSAVHRGEAFEAARFAIEMVKRSFPIWKQETFANGRKVWSKGIPIQGSSGVKRGVRIRSQGNSPERRRSPAKAQPKPSRLLAAL